MWAGLQSSEGLARKEGPAFKVTHSQGCRLEASVPRHFWQDSWPPRERVVQDRGQRGRSHIVFFFLDSFLRHDSHTIPFTLLNSTTQCFFSIFTGLCNHPLYLVPELLLQMKSSHSPLPPPSTSWQTPGIILYVSINLPNLDTSYKCSHAICGLLCLASFI